MNTYLHRVTVLLLGGLACLHPARAAQSYDNCTGFVDSVPTTISTQGVWCLRHNLGTNITSGNAITIDTNNVTIDCNDFKLGGLAAGNGSDAIGIYASNRQNATIRHCNVRGFYYGVALFDGAGHLVEDNRFDNNLYIGIAVTGDNSLVQRNRVYDTGGRTDSNFSYGIYAFADIVDNTVSGLFVDTSGGDLFGIFANSRAAQIRGNQVSGFAMGAVQGGSAANSYGIHLNRAYQRASRNHVSGSGSFAAGSGITVNFDSSFCQDNSVSGFSTNIDSDCLSDGNLTAL